MEGALNPGEKCDDQASGHYEYDTLAERSEIKRHKERLLNQAERLETLVDGRAPKKFEALDSASNSYYDAGWEQTISSPMSIRADFWGWGIGEPVPAGAMHTSIQPSTAVEMRLVLESKSGRGW